MNSMTAPIMHPTDFSDLSMNAFAHALKISLTVRCKLYIAHIAEHVDADDWQFFPHVRETLARWALLDAGASTSTIFDKLGVEVTKVEISPQDPVPGLAHFLAGHPCELIVLATHGREGLPRWIKPSVAEAMSRRAHLQTLFIPPDGNGFVDAAAGAFNLKHLLVPIDHKPAAGPALAAIERFCRALAVTPDIHILHIGNEMPALPPPADSRHRMSEQVLAGNVVEGILQAAKETGANLIGMATAGHHGILDALRGSTTERVLREAPCPVLAIPIAQS
jgi:nucleotide-binding universal stress UspA family protein